MVVRDRVGHPCRSFSHVRLLLNGLTHMHLWFVHVPALPVGAGELGECVVECAVLRSGRWPSKDLDRACAGGCRACVHRRVIICACLHCRVGADGQRAPLWATRSEAEGRQPNERSEAGAAVVVAAVVSVGTVWCIGVDVAGLSARRVRPSLCTRVSLPPLRCAAGWPQRMMVRL